MNDNIPESEIELETIPTSTSIQEQHSNIENKNSNNSNSNNDGFLYRYFEKWSGVDGLKSPARVAYVEMFWSWLGAIVGIGILSSLHYYVLTERDLTFLIGSFGASAVLIYGAYKGPLSQPRNLIGGHMISAVVGVTVRIIFVDTAGLYAVGCFVAVAFSIVAMQLTRTEHPPGGATALIAVVSARTAWAGYQYVLMPVGTGALTMLLVALVINNLAPTRRYPQWWI